MGDIADMMLDGTLCEGCGEFLNEDPPGFPSYCEGCAPAAHAEEKKDKRASNREKSSAILAAKGICYKANNNGAHLVVTHGDMTVDFWPGTGKYIRRADKKAGRGVFNLLALLGQGGGHA